jgi:hypothetical protein
MPKRIETSQTPQIRKPEIRARLDGAKQKIAENLGLSEDRLGERALDELKEVERRLEALAAKGPIDDLTLAAATEAVRQAHNKDVIVGFQPPAAPAANEVNNWHQLLQIKDAGGRLSLAGPGSSAQSPIPKLLASLGIDAQNLSPRVAEELDFAKGKGVSLANEKNWGAFATRLLSAHLADGGAIKTGAVGKTNGKTTTGAAENGQGAPVRQGVANAPSEIGTGSSFGAMHALMGNLASTKTKARARERLVESSAPDIARDLGIEKPTTAQLTQIKKSLMAILRDGGSVDKQGKVRSGAVAQNALARLAKDAPAGGAEQALFGALAEFAQTLSGPSATPEQKKMLDELAVLSSAEVVAKAAGRPLDGAAIGRMQQVLAEATGTKIDPGKVETPSREQSEAEIAKIKAQLEAEEAGKTPAGDTTQTPPKTETRGPETGKTGGKTQLSPDARKAMNQALEGIGIIPGNQDAAPVLRAFEQIFAKGHEPEKVAVNAAAWLDGLLGTGGTHSKNTEQLLTSQPSPELAERGQQYWLGQVAQASIDPKDYKARYEQQVRTAQQTGTANAAAGGGGQGVPPGFGTGGILGPGSPMDADGSKNQLYLQRTMVISGILNDPSLSIEDKIFYFMMWFAAFADKEREQKMREIADLDRVDQMKSMKKDAIYRDRQALYGARKDLQKGVETAESQWGGMRAVHGEVRKLERELERMERKAASPEALETAKTELGQVQEAVKKGAATPEQLHDAESRVKSLEAREPLDPSKVEELKTKIAEAKGKAPGGVEGYDKARTRFEECKRQLSECNAKIEQRSAEYDQLKNETSQAPKSRELLFMELERIQRFRGMLIDMANSFMRDMARRVKEIMQ